MAYAARIEMDTNRFGFNRQIVNEGPGSYRWTISRGGEVVSSNVEATLEDAKRVVRSTTNFLREGR